MKKNNNEKINFKKIISENKIWELIYLSPISCSNPRNSFKYFFTNLFINIYI